MTPVALTADGPRLEVSRPMTMVQAASLDTLRLTVTDRTDIRCGWNFDIENSAGKFCEFSAYRGHCSLCMNTFYGFNVATLTMESFP